MSATFDNSMSGEQAGGESAGLPHEAAADAVPASVPAAAAAAEEDDDGTPAELDDPFAGDEDAKPVEMAAEAAAAPAVGDRQWYILKVQSNREDSIRETLLRRISLQGMDKFFGEVVVPKEQVTEFKGG